MYFLVNAFCWLESQVPQASKVHQARKEHLHGTAYKTFVIIWSGHTITSYLLLRLNW